MVIKANEYIKMLEGNRDVIRMQIQGLQDADMLLQPPHGGNCMLWTLGHLTENLVHMLRFAGGNQPPGVPDLSRFGNGSKPITGPEEGLMTASELMAAYELLHQAVVVAIAPMTAANFDEEVQGFRQPARRGWMLFFMEFHHAYHIGQLELLRNLAGHTETLI